MADNGVLPWLIIIDLSGFINCLKTYLLSPCSSTVSQLDDLDKNSNASASSQASLACSMSDLKDLPSSVFSKLSNAFWLINSFIFLPPVAKVSGSVPWNNVQAPRIACNGGDLCAWPTNQSNLWCQPLKSTRRRKIGQASRDQYDLRLRGSFCVLFVQHVVKMFNFNILLGNLTL